MHAVTALPRRPFPPLLVALALLCVGGGSLAQDWNPYDTDSAAGRGDPNPWASAPAVAPPAQDWPRQQSTGRGDPPVAAASPRWPAAPGGSTVPGPLRFRPAPAQPGQRPDPSVGAGDPRPWGQPAPFTGAPATSPATPPGWEAPAPRSSDDEWAARERARYRFRGDPQSAGAAPGAVGETGYRYRPLTAQERARHGPDDGQPRWRDDDLQPRGPSWGLEDAGSAVGYQPDGPR